MSDSLTEHYSSLLDGCYDCVDRIVLNGYFQLGQSPGGFRTWWRQLFGSDATLDNTHLMRWAGKFSRRVRAFAQAQGIPLVDCSRGERKHDLAETHLPKDPGFKGVFLILVSKAPAPVWDVFRFSGGGMDIRRKRPMPFVNHYSFHIVDPEWGHVTIKLCGHPPFTAQIMLNGHEYVACLAKKKGVGYTKVGNCFTNVSSAAALAKVADTLRSQNAIGRLTQVCERWIYSSCLCFALTTAEQKQCNFRYSYSLYQAEYSRNHLFQNGAQMDQVFNDLIDRTRAPLSVPVLKTIFGIRQRSRRKGESCSRCEHAVETPEYDMTVFKIHLGPLTAKMYTKGERVLRTEIIAHNIGALGRGRKVALFPEIIERLRGVLERFLETVRCVDAPFVDAGTLDTLAEPSKVGATRVGGIDLNKQRLRTVLEAVITLATQPNGFSVGDLAVAVRQRLTGEAYTARQAAYDLRKLRGKKWIERRASSRSYQATTEGLKAMACLVTLREKVIKPLLAGATSHHRGRKPKHVHPIDTCYHNLRSNMEVLFDVLGIAA